MSWLVSFLQYFLSFGFLQNIRTKIGDRLLSFSCVKQMFKDSVRKESIDFKEKNQKKYEKCKMYHTMPENGLNYDECLELVKSYSNFVNEKTNNLQFSGTIYQDTLHEIPEELNLPKTLQSLYLEIFNRSHMWNGLHDDEFGIANIINLQVVSIVADLFGGKLSEINGLVTTGGTQSIMTSARTYVNFGMAEKKLFRGACTIIAPDTIHCSLMKAASTYGFNLILIPTDSDGKVNKDILLESVETYKSSLVALYCSYPSYPYGTLDDIDFFAESAIKYQVGLHVDCCLGGFIVNFTDPTGSKILEINGVTSLSADTHKNGLSTKGSSVLIFKKNNITNFFVHTIHAIPDWKGGLYGTPNDEGSVSCVSAFCALITLLYYGKKIYQETANQIVNCTQNIRDKLVKDSRIEIIGKDFINVIAFRLKSGIDFGGSTYRVMDLMRQNGYVFNALTSNIIHFCITKRFVSDKNHLEKFMNTLKKCLGQVMEEIIQNPELKYDGSIRMYCSADSVKCMTDTSTPRKYLENYFFGIQGITAVIKENFIANNNPWHLE